MRKDLNDILGLNPVDLDHGVLGLPLAGPEFQIQSYQTLNSDASRLKSLTDGETLRDGLLNFLLTSFQILPSDVEAVLQSIDGTQITQNNFFDRAIDIDSFVRNIELAAQIFDELFARNGDIKALENYLAAEDPSYHTQYQANSDVLQNRFDMVLDDAQPGLLDFFRSSFTFLWEGVSGFSRAFYEALATTVGPLGDAAQAMGEEIANITSGVFGTYAAGIGVAATNGGLVTNFVLTLIDYFQVTLDNISIILTAETPSERISAATQILTNLDEVVGAWDDISGLVGGPNANLGQISALISMMDSVFDFRKLLQDNAAIGEAATNELLSELSREFLDDVLVINTVDMGKTIVDILDAAKDALGISGPFAGLVEYFVESGATLADIISIGQSSDWQIRRDTFADYLDLEPVVADFQVLLNAALDRADFLSNEDFGADIDPVIVTSTTSGESILSARFDLEDEGSSFETGGTLPINAAYVGEMTPEDRGDFFEITLVAGQSYEIKVEEGTHPFSFVRLYNASGDVIANPSAFLSDDDTSIIAGTAIQSGTYYVSVDKGILQNFFGTYTLSFTTASFVSDFGELSDAPGDISTGYTLLPGESIQGSITRDDGDVTERGDWFEIVMVEGQDYRVTLSELTLPFSFLSIYDSLGQKIAVSNAARSNNEVSIIEGTASATGTFYIGVDTGILTSSQGGYVVSFETATLLDDVTELVDARADRFTDYTLSDGEVFRGNINLADDDDDAGNGDWIKVNLTAGEDYRIELNEDSLAFGFVRLYDEEGNLIANPDGSQDTSTQSVLEGTVLTSGIYFVGVDSGSSSGRTGSYTVSLDTVELDADLTEIIDATADTSTLYTLGVGETFRGNLNLADDDRSDPNGDWLRLTLETGEDYRIVMTEDNLSQGLIRLYDASGNLIASPDTAQNTDSQSVIEGTLLAGGTYFVGVSGTNGHLGDYTVSLETATLAVDVTEVVDAAADISTIYSLDVGESVRGDLNLADNDTRTGDWYRVTLEARQDYRLTLDEGTAPRTEIRLYDSAGNVLANTNESLSGDDQSFLTGTVLTSGVYFVGVDNGTFTNAGGSYTLSIDAVSVDADVTELSDAAADVTTGYSLSVGEVAVGNMNQADGDMNSGDWFRVNLAAGEDYRFTLDATDRTALDINLYDATGDLVLTEERALSSSFQGVIEGTASTSGVYFLAIEGGNSRGAYSLAFETLDLPGDQSEFFDAAGDVSTGYTLAVGESVSGAIDFNDGDFSTGDWFAVELDAGETARLTLTGERLTFLSVALYDDRGRELFEDSNALSTNDADIAMGQVTTAGTYYIGVEANADTTYLLNFDTGLFGTSDNDTLVAGAAAEVIRGDLGFDIVDYSASDAGVTVNLSSVGTASGGFAEGDSYDEVEGVTGSDFIDRLLGNSSDNVLIGNGGNDVLLGRGGADVLTGGEGMDDFRYTAIDGDTITDFTEIDQIIFDRESGEALPDFIGSLNFTGTAGELRYRTTATQTILEYDRDGDGNANGQIFLDGLDIDLSIQTLTEQSLNLVKAPVDDFGNDADTAVLLALDGGRLEGQLGHIGDADYFEVSLLAGQTLQLQLSGNIPLNQFIVLEGDGETVLMPTLSLASDSDGISTIFQTVTTDGTYYVSVGSDMPEVGNYELSVTLATAQIGSSADETLASGNGADEIYGGAGHDLILGDNTPSLSLDSVEGQVYRAFQAVFDRAPDLGGFNAFTGELRAGRLNQEGVIAEFVNSEEFQNTYGELSNRAFMEQLYRNVLDRDGDAAGLNAFTGELDTMNLTRAQVVVEFANSTEFVQLMTVPSAAFATNVIIHPAEGQVFRIYQAVFDRAPDAAGFAAFVNSLQNEVLTVESITTEFVDSQEFQNTYGELTNEDFVEALYTNVLPGNTDAAGRAAFINALDGGTLTRAVMVAEFAESQELRNSTADASEVFVSIIFDNSADSLYGGTGDDVLFGGRGADSFVYDTETDGQDTILDFTSGTDAIDLGSNVAFDTFAEIMAAGTQIGLDAVFDFGGGNTLTLANVAMSELTEGDFGFDEGVSIIKSSEINTIDVTPLSQTEAAVYDIEDFGLYDMF